MEGVPLVMDLQDLTFVHFPCRWIATEIFEPAGDCDIVQEESPYGYTAAITIAGMWRPSSKAQRPFKWLMVVVGGLLE